MYSTGLDPVMAAELRAAMSRKRKPVDLELMHGLIKRLIEQRPQKDSDQFRHGMYGNNQLSPDTLTHACCLAACSS